MGEPLRACVIYEVLEVFLLKHKYNFPVKLPEI